MMTTFDHWLVQIITDHEILTNIYLYGKKSNKNLKVNEVSIPTDRIPITSKLLF